MKLRYLLAVLLLASVPLAQINAEPSAPETQSQSVDKKKDREAKMAEAIVAKASKRAQQRADKTLKKLTVDDGQKASLSPLLSAYYTKRFLTIERMKRLPKPEQGKAKRELRKLEKSLRDVLAETVNEKQLAAWDKQARDDAHVMELALNPPAPDSGGGGGGDGGGGGGGGGGDGGE